MYHSVTLTIPDLDFDNPQDAIKAFLEIAQDAFALDLAFELVDADGVKTLVKPEKE
ncbi:hypothetical protein GOC14_07010 [Sinorhizobium meliloti]|nr:hypothetical protein [Sinorhizobium meliloti]